MTSLKQEMAVLSCHRTRSCRMTREEVERGRRDGGREKQRDLSERKPDRRKEKEEEGSDSLTGIYLSAREPRPLYL